MHQEVQQAHTQRLIRAKFVASSIAEVHNPQDKPGKEVSDQVHNKHIEPGQEVTANQQQNAQLTVVLHNKII